MVIFGLILLLVALAVVAYMWVATGGMAPVQIDYGFLNVEVTPMWLFIAGGITLAAATCGIWLLAVGTRSKARKSREVRELRRQAKDADRRTERTKDASSLGTSPASRTSTGHSSTAGAGTTAAGSTGSGTDAPILPRPGHGTSSSSTRPNQLDGER